VGIALNVKVVDWPEAVVIKLEDADIEKSPILLEEPVPVRLRVCGLAPALSVMLIMPVRVPVAVGLNVTLIVQLAPAASDPPQLLLSAKSPLAVIPVIVNAAFPVLLSVAVCAALLALIV